MQTSYKYNSIKLRSDLCFQQYYKSQNAYKMSIFQRFQYQKHKIVKIKPKDPDSNL